MQTEEDLTTDGKGPQSDRGLCQCMQNVLGTQGKERAYSWGTCCSIQAGLLGGFLSVSLFFLMFFKSGENF